MSASIAWIFTESVADTRSPDLEKTKPFLANVPILYPLKTPQNQMFFNVFRG